MKGDCKSRDYIFFVRKRKRKQSTVHRYFFCNRRIVSADKREDFVSDRISCIALRGR